MEESLINIKNNKNKKINQLVIFTIITAISALFIFVIILLLKLPNSQKNRNRILSQTKKAIGEISCIYNVNEIDKEISLFGDTFIKQSEFDIFIDGEMINFTKKFKFNEEGNHIIRIDLYENLDMNYM